MSDKDLKKQGRESACLATSQVAGVKITKWDAAGNEPQTKAKCCCKSSTELLQIRKPLFVHFYNNNMDGVDLTDQLLAWQ